MSRVTLLYAVRAEPMTRLEYHILRNWTLPADADGSVAGYLLTHQDDNVSWMSKSIFDSSIYDK